MSSVLCVGVATQDIVNYVSCYPAEDSEVRASRQLVRMGGNAANTALVLVQLGAEVSWVGNLAPQADVVEQTLKRYGVDFSDAVQLSDGTLPTSYITLSELNGSRSIVHFRDLPEYAADHFQQLDLTSFNWVHFEGRAVDELRRMLEFARSFDHLHISLEIEKPRDGIEVLFPLADVLFFSRDYALAKGFSTAAELLRCLPGVTSATCAWGEQGAWAVDTTGSLLSEAAPTLVRLVDTVGAGDVFNAAMVFHLSRGARLDVALRSAVHLASAQCEREGLALPPREE